MLTQKLNQISAAAFVGYVSLTAVLIAKSEQPVIEPEYAIAYGNLFRSLGTQYANHASVRVDLIRQQDAIQRGLMESAADFQRIAATELVNQMREIEAQVLSAFLLEEAAAGRTPSSSMPTTRTYAGRSSRISLSNSQRLAASAEMQQLQSIQKQNQWLQLDAAGQLILERHHKLLLSANDIAQKSSLWMRGERQLLEQYLELADVTCIRSQAELLAAVSALENAAADSAENVGAKLSLAISLMRLQRNRDSQKILQQLLVIPNWARPLTLAIRGELAARNNDLVTAKKSLNEAIRAAPRDPFVRLFRAQTMSLIGDTKAAITDWELLLKSGRHEIAAHRGLALVHCSLLRDKPRSHKLGLEHAELAVSLAGDTDWSSQLALALATAVAGDCETGATLAEKASTNALADKQVLCQQIAAQLKTGVIPQWHF